MINILTQSEYNNLKAELQRLLKVERPQVAQDLKEAISQGDLSENAAYSDAKDRQAALETKIRAIEGKLATAEVVARSEGGDVIQIGISFKAKDTETGQERNFTIVGSQEASPAEGKISFDSPLGSAFIGKKSGDEVNVLTPAGKKKYMVAELL